MDKVAPAAPSITVNTETVLAGTAEPGSTVTITNPRDGSTITVVVGADGNWSVPNPLKPGDIGAIVTATDSAGNESMPILIDGPADITAPDAPAAAITGNPDGSITVSGNGQPGDTVNVTFPDGSTGSVIIGEDGSYTIDSPVGQPEGEIVVSITDPSGNTSGETTVVYEDSTAPNVPDAPAVIGNPDGSITVGGNGQPGDTVNVTFPDGSTGSVIIGEDGSYTIDSPVGQPEGEIVVSITDPSGNTSGETTVVYEDSTAPNVPDAPAVIGNPDGSITVGGNGQPGDTVNVTFPDGSTGSVIIGEDGSYTIDSPVGQPEGEIVVSITDPSGNTSGETTVVYEDSTAPNVPDAPAVIGNPDGSITVGGNGQPGDTVNVTFPDGSTGSVIIGEDGNYTIDSPVGQPEGEIVVSITDPSGNTSGETTVVYEDSTAPNVPDAPAVIGNPDGSITVGGNGQPGDTVNVTFPDGSTGSVIIGEDGSYTIDSPVGQPEGEIVVSITDPSGNTSGETTVVYEDSTAPNVPDAPAVIGNPDGSITVGGNGQPGDTVNVTFPDGSTGSVIIGEDGSYTIDSPVGQPEGEIVVSITDPSGNTSGETTVVYEDSTAPNVPDAPAVIGNPDGSITVGGNGQPGDTVNVTFPDGSTGSVIIGEDGSYTIDSPVGQPEGEIVVSITDPSGNTSGETTVVYEDSTAPNVPDAPAVIGNPDGSITVGGNGQPGDTVNVTFPDGSTGSVIIGEDGSYTIDSPVGQPEGEIVVSITDPSGNTSGETTVVYEDSTAPNVPDAPAVIGNPDGSITVGGNGQPGDTVNVTFPDGSTGSVIIGEDGSYTIDSPVGQPEGEIVVSITDPSGNTSGETTVVYEDSTAPNVPDAPAVIGNPDGSITVGGNGQPGDTVNVTFPDGSTGSVIIGEDGNYTIDSPVGQPEGEIVVSITDPSGNTSGETTVVYEDSTAPNVPDAPAVIGNPDGSITVGGNGQPGDTVNVTFPDGSTGSVIIGEDGSYTIDSPVGQPEGEIVVSITDPSGNTSGETTVVYEDSTAPNVPDAPAVIGNPDGSITVGGNGQPGDTVNVTFPDGSTGSVIIGEDGSYTIDSPVGQPEGEIVVSITDPSGNTSGETTVVYEDSTAPNVPDAPAVIGNPDGSITVGGNGQPGDTVNVTFPDGSTGSVIIGEDGSYTIDSPVGQPEGEIVVSITDPSGNTSGETTVVYEDSTAPNVPDAPAVIGNPDGSITVGGNGQPGDTVNVTFPDGSTGSVIIGEDGSYTIDSPVGQPEGEIVVSITDPSGNTSGETTVVYEDSTAPNVPDAPAVIGNPDGSITVGGNGQPGDTVNVTFPDGSTGSVIIGEDGSYTIDSPVGQPEGEIVVSITDPSGNTSGETTVVYEDSTAPNVPDAPAVIGNPDGSITVGGNGQPGDTVNVTFPDGSTGSVIIGEDGSYTIDSPVGQPEGEIVVSITDPSGNTSGETTVVYEDSTAPNVPDAPAVIGNPDGSITVGGNGQPGDTVNVTFPDGSTGSVIIGEDGSYTIDSPVGQPEGEIVVSITDPSGNTSGETTVVYEDSTAPNVPDAPAVIGNPDGSITVGGNGQPGDTVNVTFPDGSTGSVIIGEDGSYTIDSPVGQPEGEIVVSITDPSGNTSGETTVVYEDSTAPNVPDAPAVIGNPDGSITVGGNGQPGDTVNVTFPDGSTGSVIIGEDGSYTIDSPVGQPEGEIVVSITDPSGNTSGETTVVYEDSTAPNVPDAPAVIGNPDGSITVGGNGQPGDTVNVTFPDGSTGSVIIGEDGSYTIDSPVGQPEGEIVVSITDPSGNTSGETTVVYEDSTAPNVPDAPAVIGNPDGSITVGGNGQPGDTVNVTFPDGSTGSVIIGEDGNYTIDSPVGQPEGEIVVSITDPSGNTSGETTVVYEDSTAPNVPDAPAVIGNPDGSITVGGNGQPGDTVNVTFPDGSTGSVIIGEDGSYTIDSPVGQPEGEIVVSITDPSGNTSGETTVVYEDSTAPNVPDAPAVIGNPDGSITVGGNGQPGDTVNVTFPDGSTGSVIIGEDGSYTIDSPVGQPEGEIVVSITDPSGNTSGETTVVYEDSTAPNVPDAPAVIGNPDGSITVGGNGQPGDTVNVTFPDGSTGSVIIGEDGSYTIDSPVGQPEGEIVVSITDPSGNTSGETTVVYEDSTAPNVPDAPAVIGNPDGSITVGGNGQPGDTVNVTFPDGSTGSVIIGEDGSYTIDSPVGQPEGEIVVSITDPSGNTSGETTVVYEDSTAPNVPDAPAVIGNPDGSITVGGNGQPGDTVNVTFPDGSTGSVIIGEDGSYTIDSPVGQPEGEIVVSITDPSGNTSGETTVVYEDSTAPNVPDAPAVIGNPDGSITVGGNGQPGDTVNVTFPDGSTGSVIIGEDGSYTIDSPVGQPEGEIVVSITDPSGNTSGETTVVYEDSTAPNVPDAPAVIGNPDGSITVGGNGQPGDTVNVTFPDGSTGSVIIGEDGSYTIDSPVGQPEGEIVVSITDPSGNTSGETTVVYEDSTAPLAPTPIVTGNPDGSITISGNGYQPGEVVNVTFPDGSIGSVAVDANGEYSIDSPAGKVQPEADVMVNVTDIYGNTSDDTVVVYEDTIAPLAPTAVVTDNGDGSITVSGRSEPGAFVSVTFPDGTTTSVVADAGGIYSIASPAGVAQPEGDVVAHATDINGNGPSADTVVYVDIVKPEAPLITVHLEAELAGKAEPGSTVTITDPSDGSTTTVLVNQYGDWSIIPNPLELGDIGAIITATDPSGNVSEATVIDGPKPLPTETALIDYVGKDSGFSDADRLTNDGSAGRLITGSLTAPYAADLGVQVSTDGGTTWQDASFDAGSGKWSILDTNEHSESWSIQTRITNNPGSYGPVTSVDLVLDTVAPMAPTNVVYDGVAGIITVSFDPLDAKPGDRIQIIRHNESREYTLTAADIAAGQLTVTGWPNQVLYGFETASTTVASKTLTFGDVTIVGERDIRGYTTTQYGVVGTGLWLGSGVNHTNTTFTLAKAASKIQFTIGANEGVNTLVAYDTHGKQIGTVSIPVTSGGASVTVSYVAPPGTEIGSFKLQSLSDGNGIIVDNLNVTYGDVAVAIVDQAGNSSDYAVSDGSGQGPASEFLINAYSQSAYGGADDTTFFVAKSIDLYAMTEVAGNDGVDTLKLTGSGQTLDFSVFADKCSSIEIWDVTGSGNNTLKLSLGDVLGQGSMDLFYASGDVQMMVRGNAGDIVKLDDVLPNGMMPGEWTSGDTVEVGGVMYTSYQYSTMAAELLVQQELTVTLV
ncbi:Ig-like domain-containing protein [Pseudomonas siliginis]|uniref:Ig-like domain-containing protein n=1 Tax=Pseudomonas siliginis TaxID=2842346 RepID=UPI0020935BC3|nr:Ig-like domain-containing protein [Pseudomonas siliginis]UST72281.1 Ig-like domain-containing protein [Pseudomonas siliginis]